jgi:GT2 family glycosyltransferase
MLVRREAFESVGGFDDRYWMYWEDADLCRRLVDLGWRIFYEPTAVVHHATGASGTNERTIRAFHESAARFARQHIVRSRAGHRAIELVLDWRCRLALRLYSRAGHDR